MRKFKDIINLDEYAIDQETPKAYFYIIRTAQNIYKIIGMSVPPYAPQFENCGDPETRVKHYWPISLEQLQSATDDLFPGPDHTLVEGALSLQQLTDAFNGVLPFDPNFQGIPFGINPAIIPDQQPMQAYINNHNHGVDLHAALSPEEVLTFSAQEVKNLGSCYAYILGHHLSMAEVLSLTEAERMILELNGAPSLESIQNSLEYYQAYRAFTHPTAQDLAQQSMFNPITLSAPFELDTNVFIPDF